MKNYKTEKYYCPKCKHVLDMVDREGYGCIGCILAYSKKEILNDLDKFRNKNRVPLQ